MKRILLLSAILFLGMSVLSSCKDEYANRSIWSSESMTMDDGMVVSIKYMMVYDEYYDSHLGETVCSLNSEYTDGEWIPTYYVRKGDKLYESKYCPFKYLTKKDAMTGKITHPKNELWQKKILSCENTPSYTIKQKEQRLELIDESGTVYLFIKD